MLAVHSLSKRSNLAGYRAGFVAGDPALVQELLAVRKHAGMMVPAPVQAAMIAALGDSAHVAEQRQRYARRRDLLRSALLGAGFTDRPLARPASTCGSPAGMDSWATVDWLAERGHPGAPRAPSTGRPASATSGSPSPLTDERIAAAAARLLVCPTRPSPSWPIMIRRS